MAKTAKRRGKKVNKMPRNIAAKGSWAKTDAKKQNNIRPAKVFVYALALAALGGGGYLVYDKVKRKRTLDQSRISSENAPDTIIINNSLPVSYSSTGTSRMITSGSNDNFPLKRGSKGERVRALQKALAKTTPSIKIDGQFGPETAGALRMAGYGEVIDQTTFNKITGSTGANVQVVFNPGALALSLYRYAQSKDIGGVLSVLQQMRSVADYSSANEYYKKLSFISRTIVTDLLDYAFKTDERAKGQIRNEFLRIGLKVDGSGTWSLQGFRLYKDLITIRETVVTDSQNNKIPVRRNTILGDEIQVADGMTWFKSIDNSILKVPTQDIKYT